MVSDALPNPSDNIVRQHRSTTSLDSVARQYYRLFETTIGLMEESTKKVILLNKSHKPLLIKKIET